MPPSFTARRAGRGGHVYQHYVDVLYLKLYGNPDVTAHTHANSGSDFANHSGYRASVKKMIDYNPDMAQWAAILLKGYNPDIV